MQLLPGIFANGAALYLKKEQTLILADLHIGYEEERRSGGVLLPAEQKVYFKEELDRLFAAHKVKRVILAGDIKHEFGTISREEWFDVQEFIENIQKRGADVRAIYGNHDTILAPILRRMGIELEKWIVVEDGAVLIVHGDETLEGLMTEHGLGEDSMKQVKTVICGHEHPSLRITDGLRTESTKCFLVGKFKERHQNFDMIVMPAFNPLVFGIDVGEEQPLGPLLKEFRSFSAFAIVEHQVLAFGAVERLRRR